VAIQVGKYLGLRGGGLLVVLNIENNVVNSLTEGRSPDISNLVQSNEPLKIEDSV
jgi:hypothetical protein